MKTAKDNGDALSASQLHAATAVMPHPLRPDFYLGTLTVGLRKVRGWRASEINLPGSPLYEHVWLQQNLRRALGLPSGRNDGGEIVLESIMVDGVRVGVAKVLDAQASSE